MSLVVYHHPFTRAAVTLWMLEEVGVEHELRFVNVMAGEQKAPEILAINPMGKLPILVDGGVDGGVDGDVVVTESAAIGLYLADRYAPGRLAPALDDPARGTYLRWSLFAPSVIEPGASAKGAGWDFKEGSAGWGSFDAMLATMESAVTDRSFILGDSFSMADVIFGGTLRFMLTFEMIEPRPAFTAYVERLEARPALQRATERNAEIAKAHGLGQG